MKLSATTPTTRGEAESLHILSPAKICDVVLRNRLIRSATSEGMADEQGRIDEAAFTALHAQLARGHVGLIFTGVCYVDRRGKYNDRVTGLDTDANIEPFQRLTRVVHDAGSRIFAQLFHAGSQSRLASVSPLGPSAVANPQTLRVPSAASEEEIQHVISSFGMAAGRAREAGFDGVHIHAAHGYLFSEFLSPHTNRRTDDWGGSLENRHRLHREVVKAIRRTAGDSFPITVKLGVRDFVPDGLELEDAAATAAALVEEGVAALEVSTGLTSPRLESAMQYAGVTRQQALRDKLFHRVLRTPVPEGYHLEYAARLKESVPCPVIVGGGLRRVETFERVIRDGIADFVSLGRPLIREPDLVLRIEQGRRGLVDCVSCNICAMHEGVHALKCWRVRNRDLVRHAAFRLSGGLRRAQTF